VVGDIVEIVHHPLHLRSHGNRSVRVYVIGSQSRLGHDISITRRAYTSLELLPLNPLLVNVSLVKPWREPAPRAFASYRDAVLADEPIAYYRLGDRAPHAHDEMGGPDASYLGVAGQMQSSLLPSHEGASTLFDGGAGVVIPDNPATRLGASSYTVEMWARPTTGPEGYRGFFGQPQDTVFGVIGDNANWNFNVGGAAQAGGRRSWTLPYNNSYHLVWTHDIRQVTWGYQLTWALKVNSMGADSGVFGFTQISASESDLHIGAPLPQMRDALGFYGRIQEFALYDRVLSIDSINTHYQSAWRYEQR
jgi:hypothetical protein